MVLEDMDRKDPVCVEGTLNLWVSLVLVGDPGTFVDPGERPRCSTYVYPCAPGCLFGMGKTVSPSGGDLFTPKSGFGAGSKDVGVGMDRSSVLVESSFGTLMPGTGGGIVGLFVSNK